MFNKYILIRNIATISLIGYMLYWYFPISPAFWRIIWVFLSLYAILHSKGRRLPTENMILVFAIFNLIHFFISYIWLTPNTSFIGNALSSLLVVSLFAWLADKEVLNERFFSIVGIFFIIASIIGFYHYRVMVLTNQDRDLDSDLTNNSSASFLMLIPMLFLLKNNLQKWLTLMVCLFFLILGAKRGNLLAVVIPILLFITYALKNTRRSVLKIILIFVLLAASAFYVYRWVVSNDYLMDRIEQTQEGDSSNRDRIYLNMWNKWYESDNTTNYIFGYGYQGTSSLGVSAHSDWLEILVDYGLLGILLYLMIFIALTRQILRTKNLQLKYILISASIIWFFKSVYSMGFVSPYTPILMISLGTALGQNKLERSLS